MIEGGEARRTKLKEKKSGPICGEIPRKKNIPRQHALLVFGLLSFSRWLEIERGETEAALLSRERREVVVVVVVVVG